MKKIALATLVVAAGLSGFAFSETAVQGAQSARGAAQQGGGDRVTVLERDLAEAKEQSRKLEAELLDVQNDLLLIKQHIQAQAQAASAMQATLDASEEAGFTFGINPDSRHVLLAGWRAKLAAEQKPIAPAPAPSSAKARRGR